MDPISEMITGIRNGQNTKKDKIKISFSNIKYEISKVLKEKGMIRDCKKSKDDLVIKLKYDDKNIPKIASIKRISKPSRRIYVSSQKIPKVKNGLGFVIISTSNGVISGGKAKKLGVGGEIICEVW